MFGTAFAQSIAQTDGVCPMCQWMWSIGGPFWGWIMFLGMILIGILLIVALVLLIIWLIKQIKK